MKIEQAANALSGPLSGPRGVPSLASHTSILASSPNWAEFDLLSPQNVAEDEKQPANYPPHVPEDFPYQKYPPNALLALRGGDDDHTDPDACTPNSRRFRRGGDDDYTDPDAVHNDRKIQRV